MKKTCNKCGKSKPVTAFVVNKTCKDGRAGACRECGNAYCAAWKQKNAERLAAERRKRYAETEGKEVKAREQRRRERAPLRVQCQRLRGGMVERSRLKQLPFDSDVLTVNYLMERIEANPRCECCGRPFNIALLCWRCNNLKRDATPTELKTVTDWLWTVWGNEVEVNNPLSHHPDNTEAQ